jgi:hypothetical protein
VSKFTSEVNLLHAIAIAFCNGSWKLAGNCIDY